MEGRKQLNSQITVAGQPTPQDLRQLAEQGFRSVVNLRLDEEMNMTVSPRLEGTIVQARGLEYRHIPVNPHAPTPGAVDEFRQQLPQLPTPALVHCSNGERAAAFTILYMAVANGWQSMETLERAHALGLNWQSRELVELIRNYINAPDDPSLPCPEADSLSRS